MTLPSNRLAPSLARLLVAAVLLPGTGFAVSQPHRAALTQFQTAERMREALNGVPAAQRSPRDYQRVVDAYRKVYFTSATSARADTSIMAVAELLTEMGRVFKDEKRSREAIKQYQFLVREYPGSKLRFDAGFTVGQVYKDDLNDPARARAAFQNFLKSYPRSHLAAQARQALAELNRPPPARDNSEAVSPPAAGEVREVNHPQDSNLASRLRHGGKLPLMTNVRHWSTPDYTRVAIDLEEEVKYEAGRVSSPDRIFFDLHDTKLASTLAGKSFDVEDGFLHRIRLAQYTADTTRVVLDVDEVSEYSAFFLPNPYRLIVDIHGKAPEKTLVAETPSRGRGTAAKDVAGKDSRSGKPLAPAGVFPTQNPQPANPGAQVAGNEGAARDSSPAPRVDVTSPTGHTRDKKSRSSKPGKDAAANSPLTVPSPDAGSQPVEMAAMSEPGVKDTAKPTTKPTFETVSPRARKKRSRPEDAVLTREARPTAEGETSLIRALGLKISRIVVDAGHGGHDTGTIGPNGLQEKDLVLDVALRLGKLLEGRMGADVIYTRDDDTFIPLESRTGTANRERADLFISIHANSSRDSEARGVETYYLNFTSSKDALEVAARENAVSETSIHELQDLVKKIALKDKIDESREFAMDVQKALYAGLAGRRSAIRDRGVKKAPFVVLIGANMPSILAEISFVSNPEDERRLQTPQYRQRIAESLYRGVLRYASGLSGVKVASKTADSPGQ